MSFYIIINKIYQYLKVLIIIIICIIISIFGISRLNNSSTNTKIIRHTHDVFFPHKVFIESHCGVNREIFQNTLESFSKTIEYNIESFETDVWITKDNVSVLVHADKNGDLRGYFLQGGNVKYLTWEQLSKFRTVKGNYTMPRLIDAMKLAKNKIFMNLELKDPRVDLVFPHVIKLIEEYDFFEQISLSSLYYDYYKKVEEYNYKNDRKLVFGFVYKKGMQKYYDFTKKGHTLNIYWEDVTKEICDKAHENGMAVVGWFKMIEDENIEHYKRLIENGVDVIIANYPLIAKKYRDTIYKERRLKIIDYLKHIIYKEYI